MQIINPDNHLFIAELAKAYADERCEGDNEKKFDRFTIINTYITASEKTLQRVCNVIKESTIIGGLSEIQATRLLACIEAIERMPLRQ